MHIIINFWVNFIYLFLFIYYATAIRFVIGLKSKQNSIKPTAKTRNKNPQAESHLLEFTVNNVKEKNKFKISRKKGKKREEGGGINRSNRSVKKEEGEDEGTKIELLIRFPRLLRKRNG